ncbi:uncharacterized protein LOC131636536 [Vicia villosa]|uniref:uncharacterized protein LOC131636536 n=1 Tax=Vicia villosa TaxID=3911 RepID=UPI00273B14FF|nr:uncharacterized protein LOC131636536 [Vicia villosa]
MLVVKVDDWWLETRQRLEIVGEEILWVVFRREFLRKYFLEDVRGKKEIEFLELRQGNKSVVEYVAMFGELAKFYQHYDGPDVVGFMKSQQGRGKPYDAPVGKGKQKAYEGKTTNGGDAPASIVCFKCGKVGHKRTLCTVDVIRCYSCGEIGHTAPACKYKQMVCFNYGEEGHIGSKCQKPKREQASGKVFSLSGTQTTSEDALIRGLVLSAMIGEMVVDTLAKGSVTTSLVCLKCLVSIFDRDFVVDFSVRFSTPEEEGVELLSARQLCMLMKEEVQVFALVASMSVENQAIIDELKVGRIGVLQVKYCCIMIQRREVIAKRCITVIGDDFVVVVEFRHLIDDV